MSAILWAALLALQDPSIERRVRELAEMLSLDSIEAREEAAAALVDLGPAARPVLERLAESGDAEGRGRIAAILREIARDAVLGAAWRPARRVDAAWTDVPLSRALLDLAAAAGEDFKGAADLPGRVTLDLRRATVWEALDALCRAAPALTWAVDGDALAVSAEKRPAYPAVRQDELTAWLDVVEYGQDIDFTGVAREWAVVGMNLAWTRGLAPVAAELRVTEVLDGGGRNLVRGGGVRIATPARPPLPSLRHRREETRVSLLPGTRVRRVRGYGQLLFPRGFEELRVPFVGGAALRAGDAQVALRGGTSTKGRCAFQIVITYAGGLGASRLPPSDVVVIDDAGGEHAAAGRGQATSYSGTAWSIHQSFETAIPADRSAVAVRLRVLRDVLDRRLEFDFGDLPVP